MENNNTHAQKYLHHRRRKTEATKTHSLRARRPMASIGKRAGEEQCSNGCWQDSYCNGVHARRQTQTKPEEARAEGKQLGDKHRPW